MNFFTDAAALKGLKKAFDTGNIAKTNGHRLKQFAAPTWPSGYLGTLNGLLDGAVAALPEDNFLKYCYENVTGTVATATSIYENAAELLLEDMMGNIEEMFDYPYAIIYKLRN